MRLTDEEASKGTREWSLAQAIAIGMNRGLNDMGADLAGCTPSMLTGYIIRQIRETPGAVDALSVVGGFPQTPEEQ